jgi:hypothetical protein
MWKRWGEKKEAPKREGFGARLRDGNRSGGFLDFAALEALGADFDAFGAGAGADADFLQVRLEKTRGDSGDVLTDTAFFLGLAAPQDAVAADLAFVTNFTTS